MHKPCTPNHCGFHENVNQKAAQHTALFACDGVHQCVMLYGVVGEYERACVVVGAGKKRGKMQTHSQQKQKGLFPKPLFPFSLFSPLFLPLFPLAFHSSTITPFLSTYTPVFHALHMSAFVLNQKHQQHNICFFSSSFLLAQTLFFSSFPSADDSMLMALQHNTIKSSNGIRLT